MGDVFNFSPGPVTMRPQAHAALASIPMPHRSSVFASLSHRVRKEVRALTNAAAPDLIYVLGGSGTLANEAIALHIARTHPGKIGSVVSFGEFGDRLRGISRRWALPSWDIVLPHNRPVTLRDIALKYKTHPDIEWLWLTHCETSSGYMVDLDALAHWCALAGIALYVDAMSTVGNVPVNLAQVAGASFSSGKGLGGAAGLAFVALGAHPVRYDPTAIAPAYLDLELYDKALPGAPFTQPSILYSALEEAMVLKDWTAHFHEINHASQTVRAALHTLDTIELVGGWDGAGTNPAVVTFRVKERPSVDVGDALLRAGYLVSYMSGYLQHKNTIQVCFMGEFPRHAVDGLTTTLTMLLR